jgi:hypothetical protein
VPQLDSAQVAQARSHGSRRPAYGSSVETTAIPGHCIRSHIGSHASWAGRLNTLRSPTAYRTDSLRAARQRADSCPNRGRRQLVESRD